MRFNLCLSSVCSAPFLTYYVLSRGTNPHSAPTITPDATICIRAGKMGASNTIGNPNSGGGRPQRRRTTVFSETQHRILYQHFTHCNFPEPAMFRILAKLIGLDAAVIKIWFQNERSRQRKRASFIMEGNSKIS